MPFDYLRIYLQDHRAGSVAGRELAARTLGSNKGTEFEEPLRRILRGIEEDIETLDDVMRRLGVGHDRKKMIAAWALEKAGRLKLNGELTKYSPLSRVVELEGLVTGITGKLALWVALQDAAPSEPRLQAVDFAALARRAEEQRSEVETLRRKAAQIAFA